MIDPETLEQLVRNASMSADSAVLDLVQNSGGRFPTGAERTRVAIQRALEALEANGLITVKPLSEWPEYYSVDPPYPSFDLLKPEQKEVTHD